MFVLRCWPPQQLQPSLEVETYGRHGEDGMVKGTRYYGGARSSTAWRGNTTVFSVLRWFHALRSIYHASGRGRIRAYEGDVSLGKWEAGEFTLA